MQRILGSVEITARFELELRVLSANDSYLYPKVRDVRVIIPRRGGTYANTSPRDETVAHTLTLLTRVVTSAVLG